MQLYEVTGEPWHKTTPPEEKNLRVVRVAGRWGVPVAEGHLLPLEGFSGLPDADASVVSAGRLKQWVDAEGVTHCKLVPVDARSAHEIETGRWCGDALVFVNLPWQEGARTELFSSMFENRVEVQRHGPRAVRRHWPLVRADVQDLGRMGADPTILPQAGGTFIEHPEGLDPEGLDPTDPNLPQEEKARLYCSGGLFRMLPDSSFRIHTTIGAKTQVLVVEWSRYNATGAYDLQVYAPHRRRSDVKKRRGQSAA